MTPARMVPPCWLFLLVLASAPSASAEDFIITVPVRLYNIAQGVGKAKVTCEVVDRKGQRIGAAAKWSSHEVNQSPDGLEEDIVLKFNANPGKDPGKAVKYKCDLKLQLAGVENEPWQTPSRNSDNPHLKPKQGTEFRVEDSGPLPQKTTGSKKLTNS